MVCLFALVIATPVLARGEMTVGAWTVYIDPGEPDILGAYPHRNPKFFIGCAYTEPVEDRKVYWTETDGRLQLAPDDIHALAMVKHIMDTEQDSPGGHWAGGIVLLTCLEEHSVGFAAAYPRKLGDFTAASSSASVQQRQPAPRPVQPYITREEIMAAFQPMFDRFDETKAIFDAMQRDALRGTRYEHMLRDDTDDGRITIPTIPYRDTTTP